MITDREKDEQEVLAQLERVVAIVARQADPMNAARLLVASSLSLAKAAVDNFPETGGIIAASNFGNRDRTPRSAGWRDNTMSGSLAASNRLRAVAVDPLAGIAVSAKMARSAQLALQDAEDIMEVMGAAANLAIACEALQDAAKIAETKLRAGLAEIMSDIGCTSFETTGHEVGLRDFPASAIITDENALPPQFMVTPDPRPDRKAITAALKRGPVAGAVLSNRPAPIVAFKPRKV